MKGVISESVYCLFNDVSCFSFCSLSVDGCKDGEAL